MLLATGLSRKKKKAYYFSLLFFPIKDKFLGNYKSWICSTSKTTLEYMPLDKVPFNNSFIFLGKNLTLNSYRQKLLAIRTCWPTHAVMNYFYPPPFSDVRSCHVLPWWVSKQLLSTAILCPVQLSPRFSSGLSPASGISDCQVMQISFLRYYAFFLEETDTIQSSALLLLS